MQSHLEEWKDVENRLKRQWLQSNKNESLTWETVKDSVMLGWSESKCEDRQHESIH